MAATARLPKALLCVTAVVLIALAWKPWHEDRPAHSRDASTPETLSTPADSPEHAAIATQTAPAMTTTMRAAAVAAEHTRSASTQAQPPRSYTGPDGKQHEIVYNQGLNLSPGAREQLKRELLAQMRKHPEAVSRIYRISPADIAAVVAGTKAFPEKLLDQ